MLKKLFPFGVGRKKTVIPDKDPDMNRLVVMTAEELFSYTGQQGRLRNIKSIVQIDDATYQALYQDVIERFAELVQLMPASQAHHHAVPGGLFIHTLEVLEIALTLRRQYKLPLFATEKQQEDERHLWTYAVFIAAILHDVGKRLTLCRFVLENDKPLAPFDDVEKHLGKIYRIVFLDSKYHRMHEQIGLAFVSQLLPPVALNFLLPHLPSMREVMAYIHEDPHHDGIIGQVLRQADQESTGQSLHHLSSRKFKDANLENMGERLMTQLRLLLASNHFVVNRHNGNVYTTPDGYTYLVSKTMADELRNTLREEGITDIPTDNNRIFDILQEHHFAETSESGQVIHYLKRTWQGKSDIFTVLKFRSSRLWRVIPPRFEGGLQEVSGRPKRSEAQQFDVDTDFPVAAKSITQDQPAPAKKTAASATAGETPVARPEQEQTRPATGTGKNSDTPAIQPPPPETGKTSTVVAGQVEKNAVPETASRHCSHLEQGDEDFPAVAGDDTITTPGADDFPFTTTGLDDPFAPGAGEENFPPVVNNAGISRQHTDIAAHDGTAVPGDSNGENSVRFDAAPANAAEDEAHIEVIDDVPVVRADAPETTAEEDIAVIDDVPVVRTPEKNSVRFSDKKHGEDARPVEKSDRVTSPPETGNTDKKPAPTKKTKTVQPQDDLGEAFLAWCRDKIRDKTFVVNASNDRIMKVAYGDGSAIAVVTPITMADFGAEILNLPREKSTAERIQQFLHRKKLNIPARRGQIHKYRMKQSENAPLNGYSTLYLYLFTLEKFAGDDNEIREILEKTKINGNLEKA